MSGGQHPGNPYQRPDDWIELVTRAVRWENRDVEPAILYPWIRRQFFSISGSRCSTTLAVLASIPAFVPDSDPAKALAQSEKIDGYQTALVRHTAIPLMRLRIADGATVPEAPGDAALVLEAHRRVNSASVDVELHWPVVTLRVDWAITMAHGSPAQIEEAFRTGKTPPLLEIG